MRLTNKLLLLVIFITSLTLIGSYYFQSRQLKQYLETSQLEWLDTLTRSLSESIAKDAINGNKIAVKEVLNHIAKDRAIEFAYVTDMNGELFAHSYENGFPRFLSNRLSHHSDTIHSAHIDQKYLTKQGEIIEFDAPLIKGLTARIHLGANQTKINNLIKKLNRELFWVISFLGFIAVVIAIIIGRRISSPLSSFSRNLLTFSNNKERTFPKIHTSDPDINNLVSVFEQVFHKQEKSDEALVKLQQRLLLHRELSPIGIIEWTKDFRFVDWNPAAEKIFGFTKEDVIGHHITENILPASAKKHVDSIWKELIANTGGRHSVNENLTKDGNTIMCEWHNTPLVDEEGNVVGVASYVEDITWQQQQEETLRRTQKMDALGKLTGGIAHDYNNMLGVILGYTELLEMSLHEQPKLLEYVNEIQHAGERGAKLTKRLLGFSRQKASESSEADLNYLLKENQNMLEKTLTVRIKLVFDLTKETCPIAVNVSDMEDLILNMSINAMHAMKEGGTLTFATRNENLPLFDAQRMNLEEGDYVVLTITDTGIGMDSETERHIFEPFYSTKGAEGTGLGLSQVYGFVTRSRGAIKVYSEPGHGTRFAIYFPRINEKQEALVTDETKATDVEFQGTETLLVVDDEASLAEVMKNILEARGYTVLIANSGEQALEILSENKVDAIITDIIMPGMDGYELTSEVLKLYPEMKIQLVSGFNDVRHQDKVSQELQQKLLYKPINSMVLIKKVREVLDS